jgi:epoxyqueuosine reductase
MSLENIIREKALELGYEKCGIIPIREMEGYDEHFRERIEKEPSSKPFYQRQSRLTQLTEQYPWAKSVIVAVSRYGKYKIPEGLGDRIGKHYIFDGRENAESKEFQRNALMEEFLQEQRIRTASNKNFGIVGLRFAAMKAGLGTVRKNNFFYTESGSWVEIEGWITDKEMELIESNDLAPCPEGCPNCIKACRSGSLTSPYTMNPMNCISFLTTFGGRDLPNNPLSKQFGGWIYGCDDCQDACPMNKDKWTEQDDFPGAAKLSPQLTTENLLAMEEEFYQLNIQPKFFYLSPDELWKWKVNVLNFIRNHYEENHKVYILAACQNENEKIREMAKTICAELSISDN